MSDFRADWGAIKDKTVAEMTQLYRNVGRRLYNEISSGGSHSPGTPVGDPSTWKHPAPADYVPGFARSNWSANDGPTGDAAVEEVIATLTLEQPLKATNNAPYIRRLEFTGWSPQAPEGFVEPAARAIQAIVNEEVAELAHA